MHYTKQKLGIDNFDTSEYPSFANDSINLYNGQLEGGTGPSVHFKVYRNVGPGAGQGPSCRMQLTYYVRYRGTKGANPLT